MEHEFQSIYIFSASVGQEPYIVYYYHSEEELARRKNIFTKNYNYIKECNRKNCGFKGRIYSSTERTEEEFQEVLEEKLPNLPVAFIKVGLHSFFIRGLDLRSTKRW